MGANRGERRNRTPGAPNHHPGFQDQLPTIGRRSPWAGRRGIEPRCKDLESPPIPDRNPEWTARESNPPRVACKASLRPSARPWRRASRGRLTRRARVRPSSGRQESNLHLSGSRPGGPPLTHTQSLRSRLGVTGGDRTLTFAFTARRAEPLHHGHHPFPDLDSNEGLRVQSAASMPPGPSGSGGGWSRTTVGRLSSSCANPLCYASVRGAGVEPAWPVCRTGAQPIGQPRACAPAPNRTETSGASNRRADRLRHRGIWAVVVATAPSRRLFDCHRSAAFASATRVRG
jgi:hypothetical protein